MSDLPLAYELALVVAIACLISWFMGRVLCKSKEYVERAAKKSLKKEKEYLESQLEQKDVEIHQLSDQLKGEQRVITALKHQNDMTDEIFNTLKQDHKDTLNIVQRLTSYRTQFEELEKLHDDQSKQNIYLKETMEQAQSEVARTAILAEEQQATLVEYEQNQRKLEDTSTHQQSVIEQLQEKAQGSVSTIEQQNSDLTEYARKQQELKKSSFNQNELIAQLRKQNADLQAINMKQSADIDGLTEKINGYLKSANTTNVRISSMLESFPN